MENQDEANVQSTRSAIFVRELRLQARVGVNPGEQGAQQPIVVDLRVALDDMARPARSERLRDTVDYVWIARTARRTVERRHYPLVETLATAIGEAVLERPEVRWVEVRLNKLNCLKRAAAAGVEVRLQRTEPGAELVPQDEAELGRGEEVVVVGGGVAGLSAALWCWRLGHPCLVVDPGPLLGGLLYQVHGEVVDLPGVAPVRGAELARRFRRQFADHGGRWLRRALQRVEVTPSSCRLTLAPGKEGTEARELSASTLILATGTRRRTLDVPGETELRGKGILLTAAKGAERQRGRHVLVVGGGDAACENALILARAGARVTLVHRRKRLGARRQFADEVARHRRVTLRLESRVVRFVGVERLEGVEVESPEVRSVLPVDAALVRVGWVPNTEVLPRQWLDGDGFVRTEPDARVAGLRRVFCAGDVGNPVSASVAAAAGSGATAARSAVTLLEQESQ